MAQKKKPAARKKAAYNSRLGIFNRFSTRNLLIFALIFTAIAGYMIWKSYAADTVGIGYSYLNADASHGETIAPFSTNYPLTTKEKNKSARLVDVKPYDSNGRAVYVKSIGAGIYQACVLSRGILGNPTGTLIVSNTIDGTALASKSFTPATTDIYDKRGCVSFTKSASGTAVFTVKVSPVGAVMRISYVTLEKTGDVPVTPPPSGTVPTGVPGNWTLKFQDEFNSSSLDLNVWQPNWALSKSNDGNTLITKPVNSLEDSCYSPANVSLANGNLQLDMNPNDCRASNGTTYPYTGSTVTTYNRKVFSPDGNNGSIKATYFEAKVKYPGDGNTVYNWPAWWLDGNALNWPTSLEFDIAESLRDGQPCFTLHSPSGASRSQCRGIDTTQYHTYGMYWQKGKITAYYDGNYLGAVSSSDINYSPQFLIFGNQIDKDPNSSGQYFHIKDNTRVYVDYVRVWDGAPI